MYIKRDAIIKELSQSQWVMDVCVKIGKENARDLYQHLFLIICEKSDEWIEEKYNGGYWQGIIIRTIINQMYGKYTDFNKLFVQPIALEDVSEIDVIQSEEVSNEFMHYSIDQVIKQHEWYYQKIWSLYAEGDEELKIKPRSARAINRVTGISRHEVLRVIKLIKEQAKQYYDINFSHL